MGVRFGSSTRNGIDSAGLSRPLHGRLAAPQEMDDQRNDRHEEQEVNQAPQPNSQATRSTTNSVINISSPRSFPIYKFAMTAQPDTPSYNRAKAGGRVLIPPG
jgi:hypothetical protein